MKRFVLLFCVLLLGISLKSQSYTYNYWFDTDIENMQNGELGDGHLSLNVSSLNAGLHWVNIMLKKDSYSITNRYLFCKIEERNVTALKYWFDEDASDAQTVAFTGGPVILDVTGLEVGEHVVNLQLLDGSQHSIPQTYTITREPLGVPIPFADANVKALCVANWDTDGDGELSYAEAAAVTDLGEVFKNYSTHTSFDELQYFTGLTSIGERAFYRGGFTSVVLPNTVTAIGNYAFYAGGLSAITFSASLTSIGWGAFSGCPLLSISLPASVTNIDGAFRDNGNLESIIIEEGNTVYDSRDNCNAIIETSTNRLLLGCKNTVIPNTVVTIVGGALYNAQIETVTIPASVTDIQDNAFGSSLIEITVSESNPVYDSRDNCNAIIETSTNKLIVGSRTTVIPNTVTSIGNYAFSNRYRDESYNITIPESVTSIGESAFSWCSGIASLTVLAEVPPTLGNGAFSEVPKDIPVNVPCGTRSAYQEAEGWSEFTNIFGAQITVTVNPANVGAVSGTGDYDCGETCTLTATAYEGCTFINWTENDEVVSTESEYTFTVAGDRTLVANFDGLNFITFADANVKAVCVANWDANGDGELSYAEAAAVTDLGEVFAHNWDIQTFNELQYFTGLTTIGYHAFAWTRHLTSVVFPNTITEIGDFVFYDSGLISITIPASVTSIGYVAFDCGHYIESIIVEEGNTVYDSRDNCNAIIETSTNRLILGCKNTVIPNTVTSIAIYAFRSCYTYDGPYNITIPESVTSIGYCAFSGGSGIASIAVLAEVPPTLDYGAFADVSRSSTVCVPCGAISAYQAAEGWNEFTNYQEICNTFEITASANPSEAGMLSGVGTYEQGAECTLTATANDGYTFTNWTENDEVVSTDATYTFTVTGDRTLVANFIQNGGNVPTGAINGLFSVSADKQVYFSQGNLQYQASTDTWKFAENQYDYVGSDNSNISSSYSGWIDLFGWGTSGYHDANDPYNVNYQPWSTSTSELNSSFNNWGYGPSTNMTDPNLTGTSANYDWGVYNVISNGGNQTNQWRTLTRDEWSYVLNERTTTSGIKYVYANVNEVNGLILLPDDWNSSTYSLNNGPIVHNYDNNSLSASQWRTLEQAGAVFLPAAGYRNGTEIYGVGSDGDYWSAISISSNGDVAEDLWFMQGGFYIPDNDNRYAGHSVRLVCSAQPQQTTQTTSLTTGWNWFSTFISITDPEEGLVMIEDALGEYGVQIKYLDDFVDYDGEEWFGGLEEATNDLMYMIQVTEDCTIIIQGLPVNTEEVEITLEPGWNWIGFPSSEVLSIEDAFASFEPAEGDQIKSIDDYTDFDGEEWFGDLEELTPGVGFMYLNNSGETKTLVFNTAK